MKKYEKPMILIEEFELSQHVAACALDYVDSNGNKTNTDANNCIAYTDSNFWGSTYPVFVESNTSCVEKFEGYCYTNGSSGMNTFIS